MHLNRLNPSLRSNSLCGSRTAETYSLVHCCQSILKGICVFVAHTLIPFFGKALGLSFLSMLTSRLAKLRADFSSGCVQYCCWSKWSGPRTAQVVIASV